MFFTEQQNPRVTVFPHNLVPYIAGVSISTTYGGDSQQTSHLCETFTRLITGGAKGVHSRCCNPRHVSVESQGTNNQRRHCKWVRHNSCACGANPPCLSFTKESYTLQIHAYNELFSHFPSLSVPLPTEDEFNLINQ